ncbi:folate/biopterin family MFS transporter [Gloeocapsopsis dulcis]|uniref:Folate/biopterin family MFS transporter n=1 Tax=Gloeocapsopsis dulcis AAB1 = 1H9 TaxID=1433147 RepID=A0A6N8FUL9_9CHRO|nr:folate/biopterin family MFS transporter [Gloeocapsopsis dulcis]MUL36641.1 folate/biopterin family MFS transporter [Gloeocapsopsis dulcis AAB1 = 1H9]WNN87267.1 folate/biopterin family MFS transporter [Gloeocapsopsis dulcis]
MFISLSGTSLKNSLTKTLFFGHEPTPELLGILVVYFVQGILGLARLAVSFFLKDELGLSPAEVSALFGIVALPWIVKPLFGFISDGLPILGYRRRPYLILSGILGALSWAGLATIVQTSTAATLALALGSLSVAIGDVIVDSLVVERARAESQGEVGSLQSLCWGTSAFGGLITAYFSGLLLEHFSTRTIFWITASFPLIVSGVAWLIAESPITEKPDLSTVKHQFEQLRKAITQKAIWLPAAFVFIWQATPTADAAFFFFTTNELGFEPEFLGRVRLVTSIASLVGVWVFHRFLKNVSFRVIFGWSTLLSAVLGMSMLLLVTHTNRALGIDDHWFSIGDSLILTVMGQIAYMPVLVLAARLCPPGVEATLFALLMSISNLGGLLSYQLGALLMHLMGITQTNFSNLWILVVIANVSTLLPLPFLGWLPATDATQPSEPAMDTDTNPNKLGQSLLPLMSELVPHSVLQQTAEEPAE